MTDGNPNPPGDKPAPESAGVVKKSKTAKPKVKAPPAAAPISAGNPPGETKEIPETPKGKSVIDDALKIFWPD